MADIKDIKLGNTKYNIKIPSSRVKSMADYAKPSSKPSPEAIQQSDTLNAALGKLEYKADTNQTNILYALNTGVRNICNNAEYSDDTKTAQNTTFTTLDDGTVTVKTPSGQTSTTDINNFYNVWFVNTSTVLIPVGTWMCKLYGTDISNIRIEYAYTLNGTSTLNRGNFGEALEIVIPTGVTASWLRICAKPSTSFNSSFKIVVCNKSVWEADPPTEYIPFALPNSDLTGLEAEDRAALAEVVDSGAKNKLPLNTAETAPSAGSAVFNVDNLNLASGTYVFSFTENASSVPSSGNVVQFSITYTDSTTENMPYITTAAKTRSVVTYTFAKAIKQIKIYAGYVGCSLIDIMICTKAAFCISPKFVAYQYPTKNIFCQYKRITTSTTLSATGLSYTIPENGVYRFTALAAHSNSAPDTLAIYHRQSADGSLYAFMQAYQPTDKTDSLGITGIVFCNIGGEIALYSKYTSSSQNTHGLVIEKISDVRDF